jgi:hypothetical protein
VENAAMLHELAKTPENILLVSSGSEGGYANSAVIEFLKMLPADIELWHFGDSDPKGFDILRDIREKTDREVRALHMHYRPATEGVPLTAEDRRTIQRLLMSSFVTAEEKIDLTAISTAQTKGRFEQESLGLPADSWPFY